MLHLRCPTSPRRGPETRIVAAVSDSEAVLKTLLERRSIRFGFDGRAVEREKLEAIVACGMAAPSSKNAQPWCFHVVTERSTLADLAEAVRSADGASSYVPHDPRTGEPHPQYTSTVVESAEVLLEVPATIWVENLGAFSGGGRRTLLGVSKKALAGSLQGYGFELVGIGAAIENIWIAANALGLAVAFMGDVVIAEPTIQKALRFSGDLVGVITLGYSSAAPPPPMDARAVADTDRVVWHT